MEHIANMIVSLAKLPFVAAIKTLISFLNLVPTNVYEVHGARGNSSTNRPDLRALGSAVQGRQKLHLGTLLIAWTRGAVFKAHLNANTWCWGVWNEVYEDIQSKWVW